MHRTHNAQVAMLIEQTNEVTRSDMILYAVTEDLPRDGMQTFNGILRASVDPLLENIPVNATSKMLKIYVPAGHKCLFINPDNILFCNLYGRATESNYAVIKTCQLSIMSKNIYLQL
jgi:hypothetical protein